MHGENIRFILVILFAVSCIYTDLTQRKIPNKLTFPFAGIGFVSSFVLYGFQGVVEASMGMLLGFFILFIPFLLKGMYAGDVKMLMAIGAMQGGRFVIETAIYMAFIGGIISLGVLIKEGQFIRCLKKIKYYLLSILFLGQVGLWEGEERLEKIYIPYALAIGMGAIVAIIQMY